MVERNPMDNKPTLHFLPVADMRRSIEDPALLKLLEDGYRPVASQFIDRGPGTPQELLWVMIPDPAARLERSMDKLRMLVAALGCTVVFFGLVFVFLLIQRV